MSINKECILCKHCYFVLGSAYCVASKFRGIKLSEKNLYHNKEYCSDFEEKEEADNDC